MARGVFFPVTSMGYPGSVGDTICCNRFAGAFTTTSGQQQGGRTAVRGSAGRRGTADVNTSACQHGSVHQDWFSLNRSSESKGKRAKHWLRPDFYLPHDRKYDDSLYDELVFGMVSVAECFARYNIPQVPVLNYLEHFKFLALKRMTASFGLEALARYEYLVTSKVLAGLLPVHIPADHEGVYTHLSAENVVSKWTTQTRNTQKGLSKKRPWFRCPSDVCLKWNQDACDRTDCRRKHVCATCRDDHRHSACKSKESKFT